MTSFVVLFALAALASADVSHLGYQYKVPHTSYGVPSYQTGGSSNIGSQTVSSFNPVGNVPQYHQSQQTGFQGNGQLGQSTGGSSFQYQGATQQHYQQPSSQFIYNDAVTGSTGNSGHNVASGHTGQHLSQGYGQQNSGTGSLNYHTSGVSQTNFQNLEKSSTQTFKQQYVQVQQQAPQIFKHFYVHAAPEEPEVSQVRQAPVLPPPQKHYKIIFIKTPTAPAPAAPIVPIQAQNEEKTLVYVLVKKPEEVGEYAIPKVEQKPPSKPEVFFIKYSGKEGSQAVINNIVQDLNTNTGSDGSVSSGSSFTSSGSHGIGSALSDSGVSSDASGFFGGDSSLSSGFLGGAINSGSFEASQGASETSHTQFANFPSVQHTGGSSETSHSQFISIPSVQQSSTFVSPSVQQTSHFAPSHNYQTVAHDSVNEISSSSAGALAERQQGTFSNVGSSQGLPHATYGPPNFRS